MQVVLLERVEKLGAIGDVVTVKPGYARNFLLPQGKALRANKLNLEKFETEKTQREADNLSRRSDAETEAGKMEGLAVSMVRAASEMGQLFGSVTSR
ncbi:MAG TPA: 50S ribosomal protein L9, partial [Oceanicaulis sp.]|nr:50S ribosomal protein L9 [Oceanicaulis sp.]